MNILLKDGIYSSCRNLAVVASIVASSPTHSNATCHVRFNDCASTASLPDTKEEASTEHSSMSVVEAGAFLSHALEAAGFKATRKNLTADDSYLLQFLGMTTACIDIFPNGDVIVVYDKDGVEHLYEVGINDVELVISLFKDARV